MCKSQCPTRKKRDIVVGQKNKISENQQDYIDDRFFSHAHGRIRFSRSHLSVQYNPQYNKIEEKGDDITQHDAEMKSIERLDGKDPKTVVRLKQPCRDGQSEMGPAPGN